MSALAAWACRWTALAAGMFGFERKALAHWERLRALRPGDARVLVTIACRRAALGQRDEAIALLREVIAADPVARDAWFDLAYLEQMRGEHAAALAGFARATEIDPACDRAWYGAAISLIKLGRLDDALAPLRKTVALQPLSPYGWYQLAHLHHRRGEAESVALVIRRVARFDEAVARRLERETGVVPRCS